ncbi:MAG: hypothetical protein OdinLCB4_001310 [Candidatus Odinarchaeum yellowstonii]|uniref:Uncharacterized protein n=1 Tax=Odinarchaeota yellowstonii (strain LCB_4) TaxID=1841599 RepID=A0AAF0IBP4_ODILC|nr:MAG: hypothetical protein OdinLCB4_001310 [Candidatus Odinarchaeum yellowstonii]
MFKVTLTNPLIIGSTELKPNFEGTGITINGITVTPSSVIHSRDRVDIREGDHIVYLIEHHIAALTLTGITDAHIISHRTEWNFYRPEDRAAYSTRSEPCMVLGDPNGVIGTQLVKSLVNASKTTLKIIHPYVKPSKPVEIELEENGFIHLTPLEKDNIAVIKLGFKNSKIKTIFKTTYPNISKTLLYKISNSITPFLSDNEITIYHVLGDLIGDLIGIGKIIGVEIQASLKNSYHLLTFKLIQKIMSTIE